MNKTIRKIGLLLLIIILVPVVFLILNELNNLSSNEKVLDLPLATVRSAGYFERLVSLGAGFADFQFVFIGISGRVSDGEFI